MHWPNFFWTTLYVCRCGPGERWCSPLLGSWLIYYTCCHLQAVCRVQDQLCSLTADLRVWDFTFTFTLYWLLLYWLSSRWLRLRLNMMPVTAGFLEPMCESIPLGIYASWSAYHLFGINPYIWFAGHWLVWFILDYVQLRGIQVSSTVCYITIWAKKWTSFKRL